MLKFSEFDITCAEVPNEVSLTVSLTSCGGLCRNCHSPWLRDDVGQPLVPAIKNYLKLYESLITCVCLLGEGRKEDEGELKELLEWIKTSYPHLKIALYTGKETVSQTILPYLSYYKIGPYIDELGGLSSPNTNQKFYKKTKEGGMDITSKFGKVYDQKHHDGGGINA